MSLASTALLLCDLQNDFLHPDGAYGRAGLGCAAVAAVPDRVRPLADQVRAQGGLVIATLFTLVPGRDGAPMVAPHLHRLRPFLATGDFAPGAWGQQVVDVLRPVDVTVEKVAYSAFYSSRLDWVLRRCGITRLVVGGIVTNGGVTSTVRDALVREYDCVVLSDGCGAFTPMAHDTSIAALGLVCRIATVAEAMTEFGQCNFSPSASSGRQSSDNPERA